MAPCGTGCPQTCCAAQDPSSSLCPVLESPMCTASSSQKLEHFIRRNDSLKHFYFLPGLPFFKSPSLISQPAGMARLVGSMMYIEPSPFPQGRCSPPSMCQAIEDPPSSGQRHPTPIQQHTLRHQPGISAHRRSAQPGALLPVPGRLIFQNTMLGIRPCPSSKRKNGQSTFGSWGRRPCKQITAEAGEVTRNTHNVKAWVWPRKTQKGRNR